VRSDVILKGILLAFAAFFAYSISDASVKLIDGRISPYESGFFGAVFGLVALPFLLKRNDRWYDVFTTTSRPLWVLRFFSSGIGTIGSVTAFTHLSMAEAFCLIFLLPSFVTVMSVVLLKESVGIRRWGAVILGFVGVLVVLRPGFRELSIGHVGAVLAGLPGRFDHHLPGDRPFGEEHLALWRGPHGRARHLRLRHAPGFFRA
jgi:drug/metabolite transporter (DMT)-like permease